jgi:hypothetical protein
VDDTPRHRWPTERPAVCKGDVVVAGRMLGVVVGVGNCSDDPERPYWELYVDGADRVTGRRDGVGVWAADSEVVDDADVRDEAARLGLFGDT